MNMTAKNAKTKLQSLKTRKFPLSISTLSMVWEEPIHAITP